MNYQSFDYETRAEDGTWTPAPTTQIVAAQPTGQLVATPSNSANSSEMLVLGSMLQSMQQTQMQQMYLMRDFDTRLGRLEQTARPNAPAASPSFERVTWWAIWGLLMLILGGTLTVVIILILMNVQFR